MGKSHVSRSSFAALGLVLAICLAGCTSTTEQGPDGAVEPAEVSVEPAEVSVEYGQAVGSGEIVSDDLGEYERLELPEDSTLYAVIPETVLPTVAEFGFSDADVASAQKYVLDFLLREGLDSSALDTGAAGLATWRTKARPQFLTAAFDAELGETAIVVSNGRTDFEGNLEPLSTPLIRDGLPRIHSVRMNVDSVDAGVTADESYIAINVSYTAYYRDTRYSTPVESFGDMTFAVTPASASDWVINGFAANGPFFRAGT